jgi:hypothetical protein
LHRCDIIRARKDKVRLRALLQTLLVLAILAAFLSACGAQQRANNDPHVDWSSFTPKESPGIRNSNLAELSGKAGFPFVLPSYLPQAMSHTILLSPQVAPDSEGWGFVTFMPDDDSSPWIDINEWRLPPNSPPATGYGGDYDVTIGGVLVGFLTEKPSEVLSAPIPAPYASWPTLAPGQHLRAQLRCLWEREGISFRVTISTQADSPTEIAPETRDEAMKVVTSMIEDPYVP